MSGQWLTLEQGESAESIAYRHGLALASVWEHPNNAELAQLRGDPYTLHPGDRLFVPVRRITPIGCAVDERHRFRRVGVPSRIVLRMLQRNDLANLPFELHIGGQRIQGVTDSLGQIEVSVLPDVSDGQLHIDPEGLDLRFELHVRRLDPIDEASGVQGRLRNLGYYDGPVDGLLNLALALAVRDFQLAEGLEVTGEVDQATRAALLRVHGC